MKLLLENWREYLDEGLKPRPGFRLVGRMIHLTTESDGATRDIVVVKHPDGSIKPYFKSSGVSGGGYKGDWIPFEGVATFERVPSGKTFTDGEGEERNLTSWQMTDRAYGHYPLLAKTYWNQGGAKPPEGTIHAEAAAWIESLDNLPEDKKPETRDITVQRGVQNNIVFFSKMNHQLWRMKAIDRNAEVLNVKSGARRIQFGLDEKS